MSNRISSGMGTWTDIPGRSRYPRQSEYSGIQPTIYSTKRLFKTLNLIEISPNLKNYVYGIKALSIYQVNFN